MGVVRNKEGEYNGDSTLRSPAKESITLLAPAFSKKEFKMRKHSFMRILLFSWVMMIGFSLSLASGGIKENIWLPFYDSQEGQGVSRPVTQIYGLKATDTATLGTEAKIKLLLEALIQGPTTEEQVAGHTSAIPSTTRIVSISYDAKKKTLKVVFSHEILSGKLTADALVENLTEAVNKTFYNLDVEEVPELVDLQIEDEKGTPYPVEHYTLSGKEQIVPVTPKYKPFSKTIESPVVPRFPTGRPSGLLSGKRIGINAGHGWWYDKDLSSWTFQRGNISGYIEDIGNWHRCLLYTARYLWNAGADVFPSREWDANTTEVIADNDSGASIYTETGSWTTSVSPGYGGTYRYAYVSSATTATATWKLIVPRADYYAVYEYHLPSFNRLSTAQYIIRHSGGETVLSVDQRLRYIPTGFSIESTDARWYFLGFYYFGAGTASVTLTNFAANDTSNSVVISDAIRLGGGIGQLTPITCSGPTISKPWYQSSAQYWTRYMGAPDSVSYWGSTSTDDGGNDWYCRPRHAIWQDCDAYLMVHSNAFDGTASGTRSFRHSTNTTAGTYAFMTCVHNQMVNDVKAIWDSSWTGSLSSGSYSEISYLGTAGIPGALFEVAFHDNTTKDNPYLRNPKFEDILGRAMYKGIARYFFNNPTILPLPPQNYKVTNVGDGTVRISWAAKPDPVESTALPVGYRVYKSVDGKGFDNGVYTTSTSYVYSGLTSGEVYYFQVTGVNAGGESFPTETLGVRVTNEGTPRILVVNGYTRIDTSIGIDRTDAYNPKFNQSFDYIIQHAKALDACGEPFDAVSKECITNGLVSLTPYKAVIWIAGQQSSSDTTFTSVEQSVISSFLNNGGRLMVSGSEIGWNLGRTSGSADSTFYANYLKANYVSDDAGTYSVAPISSSIFNGISSFGFDNGNSGTYNVAYPDQITAVGGASGCLNYSGGSGGTAGIQYAGTFRLVYMGFPFESITSESYRNQVMQKVIKFFFAESAPQWTDIPDVKLFRDEAQSALFNLGDYLNGGEMDSYSVQTNFLGLVSLSGGNVNFSAYSQATSGNCSFLAQNILGIATSQNKLKYSTYKINKLPYVGINAQQSVTFPIRDYTYDSTGKAIPPSFGKTASLVVSDTTKIQVVWTADSSIQITCLSAISDPVYVDVYASSAESSPFGSDQDRERLWVYANLLSIGRFTTFNDIWRYGLEKTTDKADYPAVSYLATANDATGASQSNIMSFDFTSTTQGIKMTPQFSSMVNYQSNSWYVARMKLCSPTASNDLQSQLYNYNGIIPDNAHVDLSANIYFGTPTTWSWQETPLYSMTTGAGYPQIMLKAGTKTGKIYLAEVQVIKTIPTLFSSTRSNHLLGYPYGSFTSLSYLAMGWSTTESFDSDTSQPALSVVTAGILNVNFNGATSDGGQKSLKFTAWDGNTHAIYTPASNPGSEIGLKADFNIQSGSFDTYDAMVLLACYGVATNGSYDFYEQGGQLAAMAEFGQITNGTHYLAAPGRNAYHQMQFIVKNGEEGILTVKDVDFLRDTDNPYFGDSNLFP